MPILCQRNITSDEHYIASLCHLIAKFWGEILMPDSESTPDMIADAHLHALVLQFYPDIADIVRYICLRYHHIPTRDEVEEFRGQIVLLLYINDCHRLKTFDPARGAFKTWLTKVIEHHIPTQLKRQQAWDGLDVILPGKLLTETEHDAAGAAHRHHRRN